MTRKKKSDALADTHAVLTLADGSVVLPDGTVKRVGKTQTVEVPSNTRAQQIVANTRRRLADLPAMPQTLNSISVVLTYTMFGLDEEDIAQATGLSVDQITRIKTLDAYGKMQDEITQAVLEHDGNEVRQLIAANARAAVRKVGDILENGDDSTALSAAKDILDRSGHRPADVVEHRVKMEGGLTIEVRKRDETQHAPMIDITPGVR